MKSIVLIILLASTVLLAQTKPNFNGTWVLDKDKSFSNGPQFDQTMIVAHQGETIKVEAKQKSPRGEVTINEDYNLNGQPAEFTPQAPPNSRGRRKASWLPGGHGILIEDEITAEGKIVNQTMRKWTLSADGKTLIVDLYLDSQRGSFEVKRVYNRQ